MEMIWYSHLAWVLIAGILGFLIPVIFSQWLHLSRSWFVVPYVFITGIFSFLYFRWGQIDFWGLVQYQWGWGVIGALVFGVFVVKNVLSQPASKGAKGWHLALELIWLGGMYGFMDAVFLSVIPVLATWNAFSQLGWTALLEGKLITGLICLIASLLVTGAYHLGYEEYQGTAIKAPLFGNGMMSFGYLITSNPITAIGSHIAMHITAVLHGPERSVQLPPHYK